MTATNMCSNFHSKWCSPPIRSTHADQNQLDTPFHIASYKPIVLVLKSRVPVQPLSLNTGMQMVEEI